MKLFFVFTLIFLSFKTIAHPVIYQGGWALNSSNMRDYSNNYLMYSIHSRWSVGVDHWRFTKNEQDADAGLLKLNHLLWRDNGEDHQANIYLHGGAGGVDQDWGNRGAHGLYLAGVEGDWETRKYYTSFKQIQFHSPGKLDLSVTQMRLGLAPYVASFKELQTWFMLQGMIIRDVQESVMMTPMLRFFYQNVLWEVGSSTRGDWMLNLMVHL